MVDSESDGDDDGVDGEESSNDSDGSAGSKSSNTPPHDYLEKGVLVMSFKYYNADESQVSRFCTSRLLYLLTTPDGSYPSRKKRSPTLPQRYVHCFFVDYTDYLEHTTSTP